MQSAKGKNIALISKLNWRFHTEREAPWFQDLNMKYCNQRRRIAANANHLSYSPIWAEMKKGMDTFNKGSRWMVKRDSNLNLWFSNWKSGGPLQHLIQGHILQEASLLEVKDVKQLLLLSKAEVLISWFGLVHLKVSLI